MHVPIVVDCDWRSWRARQQQPAPSWNDFEQNVDDVGTAAQIHRREARASRDERRESGGRRFGIAQLDMLDLPRIETHGRFCTTQLDSRAGTAPKRGLTYEGRQWSTT